jgi:hypothetical protein
MLRRSALLCVLLFGLCACVEGVNESIRVEAGQTTADRSTVNGSIQVGRGAHAGALGTVNGSITLADDATAKSAETVNGGIKLGPNARIAGDAETVNGGITMAKGAAIGGDATNVNGSIELDAAHVAGAIETVGGDIDVGADSKVDRGIRVHKAGGFMSVSLSGRPRVVIGPRAVVGGTLQFDREVVLLVSDSASIGAVVGATPVRYPGDVPPAG